MQQLFQKYYIRSYVQTCNQENNQFVHYPKLQFRILILDSHIFQVILKVQTLPLLKQLNQKDEFDYSKI